jgi:hypothetical protein
MTTPPDLLTPLHTGKLAPVRSRSRPRPRPDTERPHSINCPAESLQSPQLAAGPRDTDPLFRWVRDLALSIEMRAVAELRPSPRNPRTHSKKQVHQIAASIREFGFVNPVLVDGDGGVVAGHGRLEAAKVLGLVRVPTIRLDHLSEAQKRAYVIADNRLAELAGWDRDLLAIELKELIELDLGFEIEITGFEMGEIDLLIGDGPEGEPDPDDAAPLPSGQAVTRAGDLWRLGSHRLICGDVRDRAVLKRAAGRRIRPDGVHGSTV